MDLGQLVHGEASQIQLETGSRTHDTVVELSNRSTFRGNQQCYTEMVSGPRRLCGGGGGGGDDILAQYSTLSKSSYI